MKSIILPPLKKDYSFEMKRLLFSKQKTSLFSNKHYSFFLTDSILPGSRVCFIYNGIYYLKDKEDILSTPGCKDRLHVHVGGGYTRV